MKRKIIKIDQEKCNGCGLCIPNCAEGALQIIDGKARLISDLFCDGLGACIGHCPEGAITIEERETEGYDEKRVMKNIVKQGKNVIKAHLEHLKDHHQQEYLKQAIEFLGENKPVSRQESQLCQWPIQLSLVPTNAPYFEDADLAIVADCVPFAYADFHQDILKGKAIVIACPKLDDVEFYKQKLAQIFKQSDIRSLTVAHMEVPCCFGLNSIVQEALEISQKDIPVTETVISIRGEKK